LYVHSCGLSAILPLPPSGFSTVIYTITVTVPAKPINNDLLTLLTAVEITIQVDSAFYPPWDGKMSTSQRAVMLCGWGIKAGMV